MLISFLHRILLCTICILISSRWSCTRGQDNHVPKSKSIETKKRNGRITKESLVKFSYETRCKNNVYSLDYAGNSRRPHSSDALDLIMSTPSSKHSSYQLGTFHNSDSSTSPIESEDGDDYNNIDKGQEYKSLKHDMAIGDETQEYGNVWHSHNNIRMKDHSYQSANHFEYLRRQSITPVVYRFFPRSQAAKAVAASITAGTGGSIPFILIVPNVDHWKVTGQELASRGYNVIAVGPKQPDDDEGDDDEVDDGIKIDSKRNKERRYMEGPALVLQLMDVMRWTKAIVVGCDNESMMAIQAAIALSPLSSDPSISRTSENNDRRVVVGLILCGKLEETAEILKEANNIDALDSNEHAFVGYYYNRKIAPQHDFSEICNSFLIDNYLRKNIMCPFSIVWDGDTSSTFGMKATTTSTLNQAESVSKQGSTGGKIDQQHYLQHRTLIIGGGTAPHRRRPEYFAWVLSRFVEEKIAPSVAIFDNLKVHRSNGRIHLRPSNSGSLWNALPSGSGLDHSDDLIHNERRLPSLPVPWTLPEMFNEESFVVFGRVAATVLFYGMVIKVLFYQYENLRFGLDMITLFRRTAIGTVRRAVLRTGSVLFFSPSGNTEQSNAEINSNNGTAVKSRNGSTGINDDPLPEIDTGLNLTVAQGERSHADKSNAKVKEDGKVGSRVFSKLRTQCGKFWREKVNRKRQKQASSTTTSDLELDNNTVKHGSSSSTNKNSIPSDEESIDEGTESEMKQLDEKPEEVEEETKQFQPIFLLDHVIT